MALSLDEALGMSLADEADESIHVDVNTRQITIPESQQLFGVESDADVEVKHIVIDGRYADGNRDLSKLAWRVVYRNAKKQTSYYLIPSVVANKNSIEMDWLIKRSVVAYKGTVDFILCAFATTSSGEVTPEWNSTLGQGIVLKGLETSAIDIAKESVDELSKILYETITARDAAASAASDAQGYMQAASGAATAANASAENAAASADKAKASETSAAESASNAAASAENAEGSKAAAASSAAAAASDAKTASDAAAGATDAKTTAVAAQKDAAASKAAAKTSEDAAAKSAADANNTANSIKDSMAQIAANKEAVSQLKEDTTALQKRQNVLVGSETGNPASCNDAFAAPLCGLTVYGKSTQDGTPTPDAPVPIVSAGDGGSVAVKVTGKNRMPPNLRKGGFIECFAKKNTQVTVAFKGGIVSQGGNILFIGENNEQMWMGIDKGNAGKSIVLKANATKFQYLLEDMASENVCLTWNASSPDYEPYREQLITLPTPNGLPGIPVTSGGNYTDQNGQQWICDEVDLERGVKVQRVNVVDLSTGTITGSTNLVVTKRLAIRLPLKGKDYTVKAICNRLPYLVSFTSDTIHFYVDTSNAQVFVPIDAKNPEEGEYILFYVLATPIETQLAPAEISAYKALITYAPNTVVQASDGAGIKLEYQRDVNLVVKNLEDAIASMTTTT